MCNVSINIIILILIVKRAKSSMAKIDGLA